VRRLYALYLHDLSAFTDFYDVDEWGRWQPDYLPDWLRGSQDQRAMLVRVDERPAGLAFVAVAPFPHMTRAADFELSEFFLLHRYRHHGFAGSRQQRRSTRSAGAGL
jgi:predicted acetyltransferase